jgi:hypothetical protein
MVEVFKLIVQGEFDRFLDMRRINDSLVRSFLETVVLDPILSLAISFTEGQKKLWKSLHFWMKRLLSRDTTLRLSKRS